MEPNNNENQNPLPSPKPADPPAPTQIVINSEDGSIVSSSEPQQVAEQQPLESEAQAVEINDSIVNEPTNDLPPAESTAEPEPAKIDASQPNEVPTASIVSNDVQDAEQVSNQISQQTEATQQPETTPNGEAQQSNPMAIPPQPPKKSGAPKVAVIIAILIGISLIGVVVFAYVKSQQKEQTPSPQNESQQSSQTQQNVTEQTPSEQIDAATKEIDEEINKTTGDKDIPTSDSVNDQALDL